MSPFLSVNTPLTSVQVEYTVQAANPTHKLDNGTLDITIQTGKPPYKVLLYSTSMAVKEYQIDKTISIKNLSAGEYMVVISDGENAFKSKNITLTNN